MLICHLNQYFSFWCFCCFQLFIIRAMLYWVASLWGCICTYTCAVLCLVAQLCSTLCDPVDCSLPVASVYRIPRKEHWSGLPFPSLGDLPHPGIEPVSPVSPTLAGECHWALYHWAFYHGSLPLSHEHRVHISLLVVLSRYMPESGTAGLYGNSTFSFLRNLQKSGCTNLHSHSVRGFSFLHTLSTFVICRLKWWPF